LQNKTNEVEHDEFFTSYSKLEEFLVAHPEFMTIIRSAPALVSGVGSLRISNGFNDLLKGIKRGSGQGNTINTK